MATYPAPAGSTSSPPLPRLLCPSWCVTHHGVHPGEDDWVHVGEPLRLRSGTVAQVCTTIHPVTGAQDGPIVLIDGEEHTLEAAAARGVPISRLSSPAR
jgi:hypothetical protein